MAQLKSDILLPKQRILTNYTEFCYVQNIVNLYQKVIKHMICYMDMVLSKITYKHKVNRSRDIETKET